MNRHDATIYGCCPRCGNKFSTTHEIFYTDEDFEAGNLQRISEQALIEKPVVIPCTECHVNCRITMIDGKVATIDDFTPEQRELMGKKLIGCLIFIAFLVLVFPHILKWIMGVVT
jgi:hypothetical protein